MIRALRILLLRWRCWWTKLALEIDEAAIEQHIPSRDRNRLRLEDLEFQLDQLYAPQSLIMQALRRK